MFQVGFTKMILETFRFEDENVYLSIYLSVCLSIYSLLLLTYFLLPHQGIFSSECIKLAHMHSDAVDFPKTGKCPSLPRELRPDQYPDFMMKAGKPRYK